MEKTGELSLDLNSEGYIDRVETKIESPKAEVISPNFNKSLLLTFNSKGSTVEGQVEEDKVTINVKSEQEDGDNKLKDEHWIDRIETKIQSDNQSNCLKRSSDVNLKVVTDNANENGEQCSETKKNKKVGSYEITSATSLFLFNTKDTRKSDSKTDVNASPIKVKEKEVSMLYQMGVEAIGKPFETKSSDHQYPLQLADDTDSVAQNDAKATEDSRGATAGKGWASIRQESGDVENYLLEEDDDENVIIHLGSEFSQDTMNDGKEELAATIDMDQYDGADLIESSTLNVVPPNIKTFDDVRLAQEEDTSLTETEAIRHNKLAQLESVLNNIQEDSQLIAEQTSQAELEGRPNYTTQVSAESKELKNSNAQEDKITYVDDSKRQNLELNKSDFVSPSLGVTEGSQNVCKHDDSKSQEQLMNEMKSEQITQQISSSQTCTFNAQTMSQQFNNMQGTVGDSNVPPVKLIEVERKFRLSSDCKERLKDMGAVMAKENIFTDKYYDDIKYKMTLADSWLRCRNGIWEFKIPPRHISKTDTSTQYTEINSEEEIIKHLSKLYKYTKPTDGISLNSFTKDLGIDTFATFTTTRQTYHLPNCTVDLDITDFGFEVGEIEVMVSDEARITDALNVIDDMAKKLGVASVSKVPGKMDTYLEEYRPEHYNMLKTAGIL